MHCAVGLLKFSFLGSHSVRDAVESNRISLMSQKGEGSGIAGSS